MLVYIRLKFKLFGHRVKYRGYFTFTVAALAMDNFDYANFFMLQNSTRNYAYSVLSEVSVRTYCNTICIKILYSYDKGILVSMILLNKMLFSIYTELYVW